MRCAVLGAFAFPHIQGSQVYVAHQAQALVRQGFDISAITYGRESVGGLECHGIDPRWAPRDARSGPKWKKPLADIALARKLVDLHRERRFDAILAHNVEAAAVALAVRRSTRTPVVYIAHTLMRWELSSYGPARWRTPLDRFGARIDRNLARHCDAVVVLCEDARSELAPHARGPLALIPPSLDPAPAPTEASRAAVCARARVVPGAFSLYTGNLDPYQELAQLAEATKLLANDGHPIVVASHDSRGLPDAFARSLRFIEVSNFDEMRALTFAAGELVSLRSRPGGFPVKLLNYMESGRPILAHEGVADGLEHGTSAWLLARSAGAQQVAEGLRALRGDPQRATQLGTHARAHLEQHHGSAPLGRALANFVEDAVGAHRVRGLRVEAG